MTARSNHAGGIRGLSLVAVLLAIGWAASLTMPAAGQTTRPQATHDGGVLFVPQPRMDATNLIAAPARAEAAAPSDAIWQRTIATHVPLIAAKPRLLHVMNDSSAETRKTAWFSRFANATDAADWLGRNIHVAQIPDTALIEVWIEGDIARADAGRVIEDVVMSYLDDRRRTQVQAFMDQKAALEQLRTKHETQIRQLRQETSRAQGELQVDNLGKPTVIARKEAELAQLATERTKAESTANEARSLLDAANATIAQGNTPPAVAQMVEQHPQVSYWRQFVDQLEIPGPQSDAQAKQQAERRAAGQAKLEAVRVEQTKNLTAAYLDQLNTRVATTQRQLDESSKRIEKLHLDISDLSFQLAAFTQRNDELNALVLTARREREQLDVLSATMSAMQLNEIEWAVHPFRGE